jgi:hypothetical protein
MARQVPSPEPPYNTTAQTSDTTQTVALSSSSSLDTGVGGNRTTGRE